MNNVIYKYPLRTDKETQELIVPAGYRVLTLQLQNNKPCIWMLVNKDAPTLTLKVTTHGTGHEGIEWRQSKEYVGTYQEYGDRLVWHVFLENA